MKTERLLSILMILLHRKKVTAAELAEYFEVSIRTIQRDMDSLAASGIPLYAQVGKEGGYQLIDTYTFNRNFLTKDEMDTLVTVLNGFKSPLSSRPIRTIFEKLNGMKTHDATFDKLVINLSPWGSDAGFDKTLRTIENSIDQKTLVQFTYYDLYNHESNRIVEPYTLVLKLNTWYLFGYCRLRSDYRLFKISRIFDLTVLDKGFSPRNDIHQYKPWENSETSRAEETILLKFNQSAKSRIPDLFDPREWVVEDDGSIRVTCNYPIDEWVISLLLSFGSDVEVVSPGHLREEMIKRLRKSLKKYKNV